MKEFAREGDFFRNIGLSYECCTHLIRAGTAILLMGGDKTGNPGGYEEYVPIADQVFDDRLKQIEREEKRRGKEFP